MRNNSARLFIVERERERFIHVYYNCIIRMFILDKSISLRKRVVVGFASVWCGVFVNFSEPEGKNKHNALKWKHFFSSKIIRHRCFNQLILRERERERDSRIQDDSIHFYSIKRDFCKRRARMSTIYEFNTFFQFAFFLSLTINCLPTFISSTTAKSTA